MQKDMPLKVINYSKNDDVIVELPKDDVLDFIVLRTKGVLTISGGAASGTVVDGAPVSLLKKIEVKLNGQDTVKTFTGFQRWLKNKYYLSLIDGEEQVGITSGDIGVYSFYSEIRIPFALIRGVARDSFLLNTPQLTGLQLSISYGDETNLISGGDRTLAISGCKTTVYGRGVETVGVFSRSQEGYLHNVVSSANTRLEIRDLPRGSQLKNLMLLVVDNGVRDNALINNIKVMYQGNNSIVDLPFNVVRNKNVEAFNISHSYLEDGIAIIDFDIDGLMENLVDTSLGEIHLELDVNAPTGTSYIEVIHQTLEPIG